MLNNIAEENIAQINPEIATVVNFGVSFLHLNDTEKMEKPIAEVSPKTKPRIETLVVSPLAIIIIPAVATAIEIHTLIEIRSLRNKKPNNAVKKGIAAKHNKVIAAVVEVIDQIKVIIAKANPDPPIKPDNPTFK